MYTRAVLCCICIGLPFASEAATVTYNLSGTIIQVTDESGYLAGTGITANSSTFTGQINYNPAASPDYYTAPYWAQYENVATMGIEIDGQYRIESWMPGDVFVINDAPPDNPTLYRDHIAVYATWPDPAYAFDFPEPSDGSADATIAEFGFVFGDADGTVIDSTSLPRSLSLSTLEYAMLWVDTYFANGPDDFGQVSIYGTITSLKPGPFSRAPTQAPNPAYFEKSQETAPIPNDENNAVDSIEGCLIDQITPYSYLGPYGKVHCTENSPAWIVGEVGIPVDAEFLEFDFLFGNGGDGDWLSVFFNNEELFAFLGEQFVGEDYLHVMIPIDHLAGQSGQLGFVLNSVGEANATLEIASIMFTRSVPEPATLALFGLGLAGIPFVRRRKVA